ncbi:MAG: hypothetical protein HKN16_04480, partial [Saprospiraceae bacterium]|nr:hypothetical protein [Saprospiraceae bacterium]
MFRIPLFLSSLIIVCLLSGYSCRTDTNSGSQVSVDEGQVPELVSTRLRANPDRLSPFQSSRAWTNTVLELAFQKLLTRDGASLELKPMLAKALPGVEKIEAGENAGGFTIQYEILEEASWDDGSPITGHDYLSTMKIVFNP